MENGWKNQDLAWSGGKKQKGRPRTTWRRTIESEMESKQQSWSSLPRLAEDGSKCRDFAAALDNTVCNGS